MQLQTRLAILKAEILAELDKLSILAEKLKTQLDIRPDDLERIESVALRLHNFYTGCENIFKFIAVELNGFTPDTLSWPKRLLDQMALPIEKIRPAVISDSTRNTLMENLAFRHVVRNIYGYELDSGRIQRLLQTTLRTFPVLKGEIEAFAQFLEDLSQPE